MHRVYSYCEVLTVEVCSLSLEKMSKSSEKVKRYADTYKCTDALVLPGRVQNRLR